MKADFSLYLVTDEKVSWERCLATVRAGVAGGVTAVQLRDKNSTPGVIMEHGRQLQEFLKPRGIPLIINDYVEVASEVGAAGVHLGASDMPVAKARALLGPKALIGLSLESAENFLTDDLQWCDYVAASPVFATTTKLDAAAPLGILGLKKMRSQLQLPLIAIGGIHASNIAEVASAGADGVAVVSAIFSHSHPMEAARELRHIFLKHSSTGAP